MEKGRKALRGIPGVDKYNTSCDGSGFSYTDWTDAPDVTGKVGTYDSSGFVRDVVPLAPRAYLLEQDTLVASFEELRNFLWLDVQTRAYIISFAIYNGNYNSYASVRFLFEFTAGGTVLPNYAIKVLKQEVWENVQDLDTASSSHRVWLDVIVYAFVFKLFFEELSDYIYIRWKYGTSMPYLTNVWNILEIINILPFFASLAIRITFITSPEQSFTVFAGNRYQEIGNIGNLYSLAFMLDSVSILVSFFKIFKYLRIEPKANMLIETMGRARREILFFFFILLLFLGGFVVVATQMFGTGLSAFSSYMKSIVCLLQMLLGIVEVYWDMVQSSSQPVIAIVFFMAYIFLMFFVLVNIFLAILNDAYAKTKEQMDEREQEERAAKEAKEAAEGKPPGRIVLLREAGRARIERFRHRVTKLNRRRREEAPTGLDDWREVGY